MKDLNKRNVITMGLLSVLLVGLVFTLSGCGFFNQAPNAEISTTPEASDGTVSAEVDQEITFDAGDSSDSDGEIETYEWDFDSTNSDTDVTDTGEEVKHSYTQTGSYTVSLTVTDDGGETDSTSVDVDVSSSN